MLTISEFSASTRLTVKALRIYHDEGLLVPERIDPANGYRYYGDESFARAGTVCRLKELGFSIQEMKEILASCRDDAELVGFFRQRLEAVETEIEESRRKRDLIRLFIETEKEDRMEGNFTIREGEIAGATICSVRFRGAYGDIGSRFSLLYRKAGRWIRGCPFAIYHDCEYRETDADIEAAVEVRKPVSADGITCRELPGGPAVTLTWRGPYDTLGEAYRRLYGYLKEKGLEPKGPAREVYLKGPGMIIPRNPRNFVTEIRMLV